MRGVWSLGLSLLILAAAASARAGDPAGKDSEKDAHENAETTSTPEASPKNQPTPATAGVPSPPRDVAPRGGVTVEPRTPASDPLPAGPSAGNTSSTLSPAPSGPAAPVIAASATGGAARAPTPSDPGMARRGSLAVGKAMRIGEALKKGLPSDEAGLPGAGGKSAGPGQPSSARAGASAAVRDPSSPSTTATLALASTTGYGPVFRQMGLRVGGDGSAILHDDGKPASTAELAELARRISLEPAALMRRPDFFAVLPRENFDRLKGAYNTRPELRQTDFKHMETTPGDRDFAWSQSCARVSGGCNAHAREASYKKGETVPPEDLKSVWDTLEAERKAMEESPEDAAPAAPERRGLNLSAAQGLLGRLNSLLSGWTGAGGTAGTVSVGGRDAPAGGSAGWQSSASGGAGAPGRGSDSRPRRASGAVRTSPAEPPLAPQAASASSRRRLWWLAPCAAGVLFVALGLRGRTNAPDA